MNRYSHFLLYIKKSEFVRSIFIRTASVFLVVIVLMIAIIYNSFDAEINKSVMLDSKEQLLGIESAVSSRMSEVMSIAYNIGRDSAFFLKPVEGIKYSGYEQSRILSRYLVGNKFIEYLAYYRLTEPDRIYASCGEMSFHRFWDSYLDCDYYTESTYLDMIKKSTGVQMIKLNSSKKEKSFFTYVYPLPQFSTNPQAFVIALIPVREFSALMESSLVNIRGEITVFDSVGSVIYRNSTLNNEIISRPSVQQDAYREYSLKVDKDKYIVQEQVSTVNGWVYTSAIRTDDIVSGLAAAQIVVLVAIILLMIIAVWIMITGIIAKYEPISKLALTLTGQTEHSETGGIIDEKSLLTSTIATLKSDNEQKMKLEVAYQEATEANEAKSVFLSSMSHDIRTPMNAIIGMTKIALKHIDDRKYVEDCLRKVDISSHYLLNILNNVLDMSRIESGKIKLAEEVISLPEFVEEIVTIIHTNIEEKKQYLSIAADSVLNESFIGDSVRLAQVCMNILSNAIKFTPEGGTIRLCISQSESTISGYGDYIFTFSDTGIGMSPKFVKSVFDSFTREEKSGVSKVEGTGLGMAIAKNLVELMGGTIKCESREGVGTTFTVSLHQKLATEKLLSSAVQYENMPALIFGSDEIICNSQLKLFAAIGLSPNYALTVQKADELLEQATVSGNAYKYFVINLSGKNNANGDAVKNAANKARAAGTKVMLVLNNAAENDISDEKYDVDFILQAPLFVSTVINILSGNGTASARQPKETEQIIDLTGKKVLLAEDNMMNREIASNLIGETGAIIFEAANGKEAVDIFAANPIGFFDLILMDILMPVMDGYEATAAIRALSRADAATVPIYAMTANTFDEDVRRVIGAGMNGHLGKPYSADELYKILRRAVEHSS